MSYMCNARALSVTSMEREGANESKSKRFFQIITLNMNVFRTEYFYSLLYIVLIKLVITMHYPVL